MRNTVKAAAATIITIGLALGGTILGAGTASATGQPRVMICHATGSDSNPWVSIEIAASALSAHDGHGDLIPAPAGGCPTPVAPVDPPVEEPVDPPADLPAEEPVAEEPPAESPVEEPAVEELPLEEPVAEEPQVDEEPTYTAPVINCGEGTVPGWLNEFGDPTSCVSDNPCPEVDFGEVCPADLPAVPQISVLPPAPFTPPVTLPAAEPEIASVVMPVAPAVRVDELAYTGTDSAGPMITAALAFLLLLVGTVAVTAAKLLSRSPRYRRTPRE